MVALLAMLWAENGAGQTVPPAGINFLVNNTYIAGVQERPAVQIVDLDGDFVVVWDGAGTGDELGIFAQRYDADGALDGMAFRVNSTTTGDQEFPDVASDFAGNFVVVWQGRRPQDPFGGNPAIFGQRFDPSGSVGSEFLDLTDINY